MYNGRLLQIVGGALWVNLMTFKVIFYSHMGHLLKRRICSPEGAYSFL